LVFGRVALETATWRSGYATVCKTDRFGCSFDGHSEKSAELTPNTINS
jgi:hypothetical protein